MELDRELGCLFSGLWELTVRCGSCGSVSLEFG